VTETGSGFEVMETVQGTRVQEQMVQGANLERQVLASLAPVGKDMRHINEEGWVGMYNDKKYGENHQYFHNEYDVMKEMTSVRLDCPYDGKDYLKYHKLGDQTVFFDMEMKRSVKDMNAFAKLLSEQDHLSDLSLVWYENTHLDLETFNMFLGALSKQKRLRKLCINLRWCDQVTDEWLENLGRSLPDCLEALELWIMGCSRLTNLGLNHMTENMGRCHSLHDVKLYAEGTSFTSDVSSHFETFMRER